jgi:hypothetical protein
MFQIDESKVLDTKGSAYITVGDLLQEIHHLRADIARKDAALRVATPHLPDGIEFDGHVYWCRCPECGAEQGDMGNNIACETCGAGPMPTMENKDTEE